MPHSSIATLDVSMASQNDWMIPVYFGLAITGILMAILHPFFTRNR
jgi:hypothetical protein